MKLETSLAAILDPVFAGKFAPQARISDRGAKNRQIHFAFKFFPQAPDEIQSRRRQPARRMVNSKQDTTNIGLAGNRAPAEGEPQQAGKLQPVQVDEKIGRNDPCPCGSGKKYKNCHGK